MIDLEEVSFRYGWCQGSLQPPYYYEYTIEVGPGSTGQIELCMGYSAGDAPRWSKSFKAKRKQLQSLYTLMTQAGVFTRQWKSPEFPPVGGSSQWLKVKRGEEEVEVPSHVEEGGSLKELYEAIGGLVPPWIWFRGRIWLWLRRRT